MNRRSFIKAGSFITSLIPLFTASKVMVKEEEAVKPINQDILRCLPPEKMKCLPCTSGTDCIDDCIVIGGDLYCVNSETEHSTIHVKTGPVKNSLDYYYSDEYMYFNRKNFYNIH